MKSNLSILSILIVLTILVMSFGSLIASADTSTDLVDNFSTYGTGNWIGYDSYSNMRYNTENANTVFGTLPTRIYGPDWNDDIYLTYNGSFSGKMFEAYFYCDDWYVNENLVNAFPGIDRWSAYYELYSLMLSNCIEIYAGSTYTNMSKVNVDYVLGGKTPANGRLACSAVVETLPSDTQFVKLQLKNTSWVPRWGGVKITDDKSDLTTYSCTPANGGTATPTPQPTASNAPNNTPDPSVILFDDLNDFSHVYSHDNLGIFTQRAVVSSSLYPQHQDLDNPYVSSVARRDGGNSSLEASLTYDLGEVNASTTTVSVGVLYNYGGTYAGGQPETDTSLDNLNRLLGYIQLKIYESADGQNFTENNSAVLTKYPGPWMGQSMHYVVYSMKGLTEGTKYVKFVIPDIRNVSVELYGWDSMFDYVKVIDKSKGGGTTVVTDNLDDKSIMLEMSSNMIIAQQNVVVSSELYSDHQDLNNPYKSNMARREGSNSEKEGYIIYELGDYADKTTVTIDSFYNFAYGYAGADPQTDSALDHLNKLLEYTQFKFYESSDGVNYTEATDVSLRKIPGPWGGQSMHYVGYTIKGLSADSTRFKIVIPSVEAANANGAGLYGWEPFIDSVSFKTVTGTYTSVFNDPLDGTSLLYNNSNNMIISNQNIVVSSDLYPEHQDLDNPYKTNVARRDGGESGKEGYLIYKLDEVNNTTTINVDSFYEFHYGYAGANPQTDSALEHLNKLLEYTQLKFYASSDGINYTELNNVELKKIPGPWGGQSMHYVGFTVKGLTADTSYVKISIPSIEAANANGIGLYGWEPFIDSVKFTTTYNSGGVSTDTKLSLSNIYMSNMILQANAPVIITGTAAKDKTVTATFSDGVNEYTKSAVADANEEFSITFDGFDPGYTYYTLQVTDGTTTKSFANILFGDVFLATGQSNVRWYLQNYWFASGDYSSANDITNANFEFFKVMTVDEKTASMPSDTTAIGKSWYSVNSSTAGETGAYLFYLGRQLLADKNYPIGIVDASWGGQSIGGFMPNGTIYNSHIYPFRNMKFKACLWWQGESDSNNATAYAAKQIKLIDGYRELFGKDLPFVFIQLENFERDGYAYQYQTIRPEQNAVYKHYLEQAQGKAEKPSVGMVSVIDMMPERHDNDHPEGKKYVAERTIKCLNSIAYGSYDEFSGPLFTSAVKHDGEIDITFSHTTGGLATIDGGTTVNCFKLTDALGVKTNVTGTIDGNRIVIRTNIDAVSVEYATDNYNYNANLKNGFGFIAPAFEAQAITDRGITGYTLTNNTLISVRLTDAECESGKLIAAVYDDYKLTGIKTVNVSVGDYTSSTAEIPVNISVSGGNYLKLYFVDSFGNIKPLISNMVINYLN